MEKKLYYVEANVHVCAESEAQAREYVAQLIRDGAKYGGFGSVFEEALVGEAGVCYPATGEEVVE